MSKFRSTIFIQRDVVDFDNTSRVERVFVHKCENFGQWHLAVLLFGSRSFAVTIEDEVDPCFPESHVAFTKRNSRYAELGIRVIVPSFE